MITSALEGRHVRISEVLVENLHGPRGIWTATPRYSWVLDAGSGTGQSAYQLEVVDARRGATQWTSGEVVSDQSVLVTHGGDPLVSNGEYLVRVRVRAGGVWSEWAQAAFATALLRREDWVAPFVVPVQVPISADGPSRVDGDWAPPVHDGPPESRLRPAKYLRHSFHLASTPVRARLFATAHGVYAAEVNGVPVSDETLAPGYESYDRLLSVQAYDLSGRVHGGQNTLGIVLGDGWYGGRIDFTGTSAQYGDTLSAGWQLCVEYTDGTNEIVVPGTGVVSTDAGPIRYSDLFIGERYDARHALAGWSTPHFDDTSWTTVAIAEAPEHLVPFIGEPVRPIQELSVQEVITTPSGDTVLDFGQVIAGRVRISVTGPRGAVVTLEHSEVLDAHGEFFMNIAGFNKDQTDVYVMAGDPRGETWKPLFAFHGFRFVRVSGLTDASRPEQFRAVVVASDLRASGDLQTSDPAITRLHQNAVWSQRANFLAIPTDCPQRERVGWTGDLQVFAPSAVRNMHSLNFLRRWLRNVRADQDADGLVPVIVPVPPFMHSLSAELADDPLLSIKAAAGWGDAITLVPWTLYQRYGDRQILAENYDAMAAWVDRQARVAASGLPARLHHKDLDPQTRSRQRYLWNSEASFGDWNAPSVKAEDASLEHLLDAARTTGEVIAPLFHLRSTELLAKASRVLGMTGDADRYESHAERIRDAFAGEYLDTQGNLLVETQGTYVLALAFDAVPEHQQAHAMRRLVELVHAAGDHLDTGFLSVPYLLDVLWDGGERELARTILWQRSAPGWLYAVDRGATTIWEEWAAIAPDGTVGHASFNHYAFGCVDDWLYRRIGGLQCTAPGYRRFRVEPDLDAPLAWAEAHEDTPQGRAAVRWERLDETVELTVTVPGGVAADVRLSAGWSAANRSDGAEAFTLGPGTHRVLAHRA
ncbi:MAG: family 78 glycoside hydrolase catalytic domain [Cellulomonadaceae bacterium]|nr:family 78 glycoside hydrolase catalytic domain [Cellulomonadaceae bacterium]